MSLIGSLEDLNLGDILQIIYLSQKSGALVIRSDEGQGRILFREGLVCGGGVKGGPSDLRSLLVGGGFVSDGDFAPLADRAGADPAALEGALIEGGLITAERLDSLRRETVEAAVASMFHWTTGEFSFDLQREADAEESQLLLGKGINPQFLAMERVRLEDESGRGYDEADEFDDGVDPNEMSAEEMFGVAPSAPAEADPVHELAMVTAERVEASDEGAGSSELPAADLLDADLIEAEPVAVAEPEVARASAVAAEPRIAAEVAPPHPAAANAPVIVIDPDLVVLEWLKQALKPAVPKVHIFQHSELGLNRIRQYLVRGQVPLVLMSPEVPGDRSTGITDASDFVTRLKGQSPNLSVFWLLEDGGEIEPPSVGDGSLVRPAARAFRNPGAARRLEEMAATLRQVLTGGQGTAPAVGPAAAPVVGPPAAAPIVAEAGSVEPVEALGGAAEDCEIERSLREASSRGEILPLVIEHSREIFSRVALFMVRDDLVMGIAQSGLDACGGPDDHGLRALNLQGENSAWLRAVLTTRRPVVAAPEGDGDFQLARQLGDRAPGEAYLGPIESGGQIVALLYADNLPGELPIGDTSRVERLLEHAGRALDREVRERTGAS